MSYNQLEKKKKGKRPMVGQLSYVRMPFRRCEWCGELGETWFILTKCKFQYRRMCKKCVYDRHRRRRLAKRIQYERTGRPACIMM